MIINRYSQEYDGFFESIWVDWLTNRMGIEPQPSDIEEVRNPLKSYIQNGGMAFYCMKDNWCVGVVAVKKLNERDYEFCKLVVSESARGTGIGKKLVQECIHFVTTKKGQYLYLQTFYKLEVALKMYESLGFTKTDAPDGMNVVKRTEIIMRLKLND